MQDSGLLTSTRYSFIDMLDFLFCFVCINKESGVSVKMSRREESNEKNVGVNPQRNGADEQKQT